MRYEEFDDRLPAAARPEPACPAEAVAAAADEATQARLLALGQAEAELRGREAALEVSELRLARLCAALEAEKAALDARLDALAADLSRGFEAAARACLPAIAGHGFAAEAAEAVLAIARQSGRHQLALSVSPGDVDALADSLERRAGRESFTLAPDPALAAGQVRLDWQDGGAAIDSTAFEAAALAALERHLDRIIAKEGDDERHGS